jgi:hypothetical protein
MAEMDELWLSLFHDKYHKWQPDLSEGNWYENFKTRFLKFKKTSPKSFLFVKRFDPRLKVQSNW